MSGSKLEGQNIKEMSLKNIRGSSTLMVLGWGYLLKSLGYRIRNVRSSRAVVMKR